MAVVERWAVCSRRHQSALLALYARVRGGRISSGEGGLKRIPFSDQLDCLETAFIKRKHRRCSWFSRRDGEIDGGYAHARAGATHGLRRRLFVPRALSAATFIGAGREDAR